MRTIALAYKDFDRLPADWAATTTEVKNADGTDAFIAETELVLMGIVGIEDRDDHARIDDDHAGQSSRRRSRYPGS